VTDEMDRLGFAGDVSMRFSAESFAYFVVGDLT
jgi:hypothetical protein